jgi:hypothetical protein
MNGTQEHTMRFFVPAGKLATTLLTDPLPQMIGTNSTVRPKFEQLATFDGGDRDQS